MHLHKKNLVIAGGVNRDTLDAIVERDTRRRRKHHVTTERDAHYDDGDDRRKRRRVSPRDRSHHSQSHRAHDRCVYLEMSGLNGICPS